MNEITGTAMKSMFDQTRRRTREEGWMRTMMRDGRWVIDDDDFDRRGERGVDRGVLAAMARHGRRLDTSPFRDLPSLESGERS